MHFHISLNRKVFPERMADETVVGQNTTQVRMVLKENAIQIERFPLEPVGRRPDVNNGRHFRPIVPVGENAHSEATVKRNRQQVNDHCKAASVHAVFLMGITGVIDATQIDQFLETQGRVVF